MSDLRTAAQQALAALEGGGDSWRLIGPAITALRAALEQPEQEPVSLPCCGYRDARAIKWNPFNGVVQCHNCGQTYTHPPRREWRGLTDEAVIELLHSCDWRGMHLAVLARAIEQALKEKNHE